MENRSAGTAIAPNGRPPFRADHIGSLLRPPKLRQAFRRHLSEGLDDAEFKAAQEKAGKIVSAYKSPAR